MGELRIVWLLERVLDNDTVPCGVFSSHDAMSAYTKQYDAGQHWAVTRYELDSMSRGN